ncbi:hypothetical protein PBY51_020547 [Eleginops maclovinus]|nr:hypothetical protein PBY51_020547 [Eleginops maclovinus]
MYTQTAALRQEIVSIRQELQTTSSLQSANAQNTKRNDDLEQSSTEWSMALETTVKRLQSEVCSLSEKCLDLEGRSRRQNIRLIGIAGGEEGRDLRQFCATVLKEVSDLEDTPRLDRSHRTLAPKPKEGERPRPFIIRVHHGDMKTAFSARRRRCSTRRSVFTSSPTLPQKWLSSGRLLRRESGSFKT